MTDASQPSPGRHLSALQRQWDMIELDRMPVREPELAMLLQILNDPGSIAEVVAQPGMGKTTFLKIAAERYRQQFGGVIEYVAGGRGFALTDAIDVIAERFRNARGQSLLVVDQAEMLDVGATLEAINRLSTGPWSFSTALGTRLATGIGKRISLNPLDYGGFERFVRDGLRSELPSDAVDQLWHATHGNPALARALVDRLRTGASVTVEEAKGLLVPWNAPGLVGADGHPLRAGGSTERQLLTDVRFVSDDLVERLERFSSKIRHIRHAGSSFGIRVV